MRNNLFPVAKEGWNYIGYAFAAFIFFAIVDLNFFQFLSFFLIVFFVYVYRNPERQMPMFQENSVVSPVDGVVLSIEELVDSEFAYKIEIDSSYLDVAILRVPMNSFVEEIRVTHGAKLSGFDPLSHKINENAQIVFQDKASNKVKVIHRLKQSFDAIHIDVMKSQNLSQASRYGVMINGTATICLPHNFRLNITLGNQLIGSETLLGYFS